MDSSINTIDNEDLNVLNTLFDTTNNISNDNTIKENLYDIEIEIDNKIDNKHIIEIEPQNIINTTINNIVELIHNDNMSHNVMNDIGNMNDFDNMNMNAIKNTLTHSIHNFETQLTDTTNNTIINTNTIPDAIPDAISDTINTNTQELQLLTNKFKKYEHLDLELPKVTFKNTNLNEIKTFNKFNTISNISNSNSINSQHSTSESSYSQHIKKPNNSYLAKALKNIRATKSQKQSSDIDEIDHVYNKLQDYVRYMNIDRKNYIMIICKAIEIIENYKDFKTNISNIKKDIITKALNRLIKLDLVLNDFDKKLFLATTSNIIDLLVNSTKNNLNDKHKIDKKVNNNNNTNTRDDIILARSGQISYSLVDKLTTIVIKKHYSLDKILVNIGTLTNILMILADKYVYLSGVEKKLIVLQSIEVFFNERLQYIMDLEEDKKQELLLSLESVPLLIDIIVTLQKGKYKINKKTDIHKEDNDDDDGTSKKNIFCIFKKKIKYKKNEYDF